MILSQNAGRLAGLVALGLVAACSATDGSLPLLQSASRAGGDYILGPGDKVRIDVLDSQDLSGEYLISADGDIDLPGSGEITAAGLTEAQLGATLQKRLKEAYGKKIPLSVQIATYRPFYTLGEVVHPGPIPYAAGLTVAKAVSLSGGYTYRADKDFAIVTRNSTRYRAKPGSTIEPDDEIEIEERLF